MDIAIPEGMTDAALLAVIIGFLAPLVLNFIVSATWPAWAKSLAAFVFAAVAGILTAWITGAFQGLSILSTVLLILVVSITSYQNFWKQVAPNMQRGAAEKQAQDEAAKKAEIVEVAAPVAANVAQQVVNDQTVLPEMQDPTAEGAVG
jgi:hypothetical protein